MRKNYRFSPITIKRIEERNIELYPNETEYIEEAIASFVNLNQIKEYDAKMLELEQRIRKLEKESNGFQL